ncbi:alpha/beta hydrolase family protein [Nakamurella multipartita]|jgi:predicted alpha/beta hydrolase|uniref:Putative hydrolase n=1 Tax=Nakamurella multipartita (strain ATCC 700099 / DSM 44233 / CIP 104796 / JCM 9543 / NBRC 105858 / Y-104) TaxID=479431 RepID=C8X9E1_NAKMY|nr:alpha/beta hydrolase [Nakamurella multipartita]ACV77209.1 putative hydrolase [Nakamurella multipartita DSM 44233]
MALYDTRYNETIAADDGRLLRATWFPARDPRGAVLLVPAMATPASFYRPLAAWLAESGFLTLTFDYRGTGGRAELRAERGDILRWAGDAASALEALVERADGLPVTWLGHSLGAQILPFAHHGLIDQVIAVASGNGYWRHNVPAVRRRAPVFWRTVVPAAIATAGYFPGRRLGIIGDVPATVMRQWGRWCLSPGYFEVDVPRIRDRAARVTTPMTSIWFTDDELVTATAIDTLDALFAGTPVEQLRLDPAGFGLTRVGHHGFFREPNRELWASVLAPRLAALPILDLDPASDRDPGWAGDGLRTASVADPRPAVPAAAGTPCGPAPRHSR